MSQYIIQRSVQLDGEEAQQLRQIISRWVDRLPEHPYQDLGKAMQFRSIRYLPAHELQLDSQFKSVTVTNQHHPHSGIYPAERQVKPDISLRQGQFQTFTQSFIDPNTEHISSCTTCGARGSVTCHECQGRTQVACHTCGTTGQTNCMSCHGRGTCNGCGGSGRTNCNACFGQVSPRMKSVPCICMKSVPLFSLCKVVIFLFEEVFDAE